MPHSKGLFSNPCPDRIKPIVLRSILILFSHLRLGLPKDLFPLKLLSENKLIISAFGNLHYQI